MAFLWIKYHYHIIRTQKNEINIYPSQKHRNSAEPDTNRLHFIFVVLISLYLSFWTLEYKVSENSEILDYSRYSIFDDFECLLNGTKTDKNIETSPGRPVSILVVR